MGVMHGDGERQKLIEEKLTQAEAKAAAGLAFIREAVRDFLVGTKGYSDGDIETDREFEIALDGKVTPVSVDYILNLSGRRFAVIKCSPGALESRERHLVSFARVVDTYQIPMAVVTDGMGARILDTLSGKLVAEDLASIPARKEAEGLIGSMTRVPCPPERKEKEQRILLAFDAIKCTEESCE